MMLNQCTKDFQSLIERLQLLRAYEDADENSRWTLLSVTSILTVVTWQKCMKLDDTKVEQYCGGWKREKVVDT